MKTFIRNFIYNTLRNDLKQRRTVPMVIYNDFIGLNILIDGYYEKNIVESIFNSFDFYAGSFTCIDVGANIGNHSLLFSQSFKKVISFEPQIKTFKILELNTNSFDNISIYNFGLSSTNKEYSINVPYYNNGSASIDLGSKNDTFIEKILLKKYDDLSFEDEIAYVKIDVEGHEFEVLEGMKKTILKYKPVISFEYNSDNRDQIINKLKQLGYQNFFVPNDYKIERLIHSNGFLSKIIKFIIKIFLKKPKNCLIQENFPTDKNYLLVTTYCTNSKFRLK